MTEPNEPQDIDGTTACSDAFCDSLFKSAGVFGPLALIGTRLWQIVFCPELTEAQALIRFWPLWGISASLIIASFLWFRSR